jgi:hypothetical protein
MPTYFDSLPMELNEMIWKKVHQYYMAEIKIEVKMHYERIQAWSIPVERLIPITSGAEPEITNLRFIRSFASLISHLRDNPSA